MKVAAPIISLLLTSTALSDEFLRCTQSANLNGACFSLHGRLYIANGTPSARIHVSGTRRVLGIVDASGEPEGKSLLPMSVTKLFGNNVFMGSIVGDYFVCPLTGDHPGTMRIVCVESATNLLRRPR
jgi:hypothetical protein